MLTLVWIRYDTQELYQQCILLRPKIVKLLDKYSQKQSGSRMPLYRHAECFTQG